MNERTKTLINALMDWRHNYCESLCADCPLFDCPSNDNYLNYNDLCGLLEIVADNIIANKGKFTPIGENGSYGTLGEWEGLDKE